MGIHLCGDWHGFTEMKSRFSLLSQLLLQYPLILIFLEFILVLSVTVLAVAARGFLRGGARSELAAPPPSLPSLGPSLPSPPLFLIRYSPSLFRPSLSPPSPLPPLSSAPSLLPFPSPPIPSRPFPGVWGQSPQWRGSGGITPEKF